MLELRNVSFSVDKAGGRKDVLKNISICFEPGKITAITGLNGSGKSTLAQIVMGIKKPTKGRVFWQNKDITDKTVTDRAKLKIAFSFQQPVKIKGISVYELIDIAKGGGADPQDIANCLKAVGLSPDKYLTRETDAGLSGGELKRIELASVLARDAEVAIFDEPEAGIDLWSFNNLTTVFKKMRSEGKERTLIIISHQEKILKIADNIVILEAGKIKAYGKSDDVLKSVLRRLK